MEKRSTPATVIINKDELEKNPSLMEAFAANWEAITPLMDREQEIKADLEDLEQKISISIDLGMTAQGLKAARTRLKNELNRIPKMIQAYSKGYLEMPSLGPGEYLEDGNFFGVTLGSKVPLRVFEAVKKAKDLGLFEEIKIIRPIEQRGQDPIIFGTIGKRVFYITSYR